LSLADGEIEKELRSWDRFADALKGEERRLFREMMASSYENAPAMQVKSSPFPMEAVFMSLVFSQHRTIAKLRREIEELKEEMGRERLDP
jgi:hypothetical protein